MHGKCLTVFKSLVLQATSSVIMLFTNLNTRWRFQWVPIATYQSRPTPVATTRPIHPTESKTWPQKTRLLQRIGTVKGHFKTHPLPLSKLLMFSYFYVPVTIIHRNYNCFYQLQEFNSNLFFPTVLMAIRNKTKYIDLPQPFRNPIDDN